MINNTDFAISVFEDNAGNLYLSVIGYDSNGDDEEWIGFYANALDYEPCYLRAANDYTLILEGANPFCEDWETEFSPHSPVRGTEIFRHPVGYEPVGFVEASGNSGRHFMALAIPLE